MLFWILIGILNRKFSSYEKNLITNLLRDGAFIHEESWDNDNKTYGIDIRQSVIKAYKNHETIYGVFAGEKEVNGIIGLSVCLLDEYWNESMDIIEGNIEF